MDRPALLDALRNRDAVMRAFLAPDGSLRDIPTKIGKRLVVLDHLASPEVGQLTLRQGGQRDPPPVPPDHAVLRRYLSRRIMSAATAPTGVRADRDGL
jgi:hypothetical protein